MSQSREMLGSRLGFLLLSAGCAIGLGNVWRFPYITGAYGGAVFVGVYLLCLLAVLPVMIMVLFRTSSNFLLMKSNVSQIKDEDYTVTARSKGLPERRILFRHVLKNAMLPYITSLCIQVGSLLSGSMMLEVIFGWKGMGQLFYNAVSNRDFPTAQACFIISATCVVLGNWLGDALVAAIDPRIKEGTVHA